MRVEDPMAMDSYSSPLDLAEELIYAGKEYMVRFGLEKREVEDGI